MSSLNYCVPIPIWEEARVCISRDWVDSGENRTEEFDLSRSDRFFHVFHVGVVSYQNISEAHPGDQTAGCMEEKTKHES